jgi:hypothetical protein
MPISLMHRELVICASCLRHVRGGERRCPFCAADLGAPAALHRPSRTHVQLGRVLVVVGASMLACTSGPPNTDVQGSCEGSYLRCRYSSDSDVSAPTCYCGTGGRCQDGRCVSCDCNDNQWCDQSNGKCNDYDHSSRGACYGCPPILA